MRPPGAVTGAWLASTPLPPRAALRFRSEGRSPSPSSRAGEGGHAAPHLPFPLRLALPGVPFSSCIFILPPLTVSESPKVLRKPQSPSPAPSLAFSFLPPEALGKSGTFCPFASWAFSW